jgi:uncharacterized delta-60 repeat protein
MNIKRIHAAATDRRFAMLLFMAAAALLPAAARAQSPLDGFNPGSGASEPVHAVALQADGKVLIGGQFTDVQGRPRVGVVRLNANGTLDESFDADTNGTVSSLYVQHDGKILVGGGFSEIAGQLRPGLARLNPDGTLDTAFDARVEEGSVFAILEQPDRRIVIAGIFARVGGQTRRNLARIEADGSLDATFNPGWGPDSYVVALARQLDGKILIGGQFQWFGDQPRRHLARVHADGSLDNGFDPGANGLVRALAVHHGNIFVGGGFTSIAQVQRTGIALLDTYGKAYDVITSIPGAPDVFALSVYEDGSVLLGGDFLHYNGEPRAHIARLNADGMLDSAFDPGTDGRVHALLVQGDGRIFLGGAFATVAGQPSRNIARLMPDGVLEPQGFDPQAWGSYLSEAVYAIAVQPDGKILIGGEFAEVAGTPRGDLARLLPDGRLDKSFNAWVDRTVKSVVVQPDGKILIGGFFDMVQGRTRYGLARLEADDSLDTSFVPGQEGTVFSMALQPDGKILALGWRLGTLDTFLSRLNPDGSLDTSFDTGALKFMVDASALAVQRDGKILVIAGFQQPNGEWRLCLVRLNPDGSRDKTFNPEINGNVTTHALQPDGRILVSGWFNNVNGTPRPNFARLNPDGSLDGSFSPTQGFAAYTIALQADGKILMATLARLWRFHFDGRLDGSFAPKPPRDAQIYSLIVQADGRVLVGGEFAEIGGVPRSNIARLTNDGVAVDDLIVPNSGTTVFWQRGGIGPEVDWVTFEISTDGIHYDPLGFGTRVAGGWRLNGLDLPRWLWLSIRARGFYSGGRSSSGSVAETRMNGIVLTD